MPVVVGNGKGADFHLQMSFFSSTFCHSKGPADVVFQMRFVSLLCFMPKILVFSVDEAASLAREVLEMAVSQICTRVLRLHEVRVRSHRLKRGLFITVMITFVIWTQDCRLPIRKVR